MKNVAAIYTAPLFKFILNQHQFNIQTYFSKNLYSPGVKNNLPCDQQNDVSNKYNECCHIHPRPRNLDGEKYLHYLIVSKPSKNLNFPKGTNFYARAPSLWFAVSRTQLCKRIELWEVCCPDTMCIPNSETRSEPGMKTDKNDWCCHSRARSNELDVKIMWTLVLSYLTNPLHWLERDEGSIKSKQDNRKQV